MVLSEGIDWRVGTGENISIVNHAWIPDSINYKLSNEIRTKTYLFVVDLINSKTREWRRDQILDTFSRADADRILRIPLAKLEIGEERVVTNRRGVRRWAPPSEGRIKINFDAVFDEGNSRSETGIVAKSNQGKVLFSRTILHAEVGTAFAAEALACLWAIKTSSEMGFSEIIIVGDSLSIVKKCNTNIHDRSEISAYIRNIKQEMNRFSFIRIQHINR
ncbi:hypothetical protein Goari_011481, partial [Gossypium aridum]|nr:hypothetical protein [Gossypium aridum]